MMSVRLIATSWQISGWPVTPGMSLRLICVFDKVARRRRLEALRL
jgi:hypothetical protein